LALSPELAALDFGYVTCTGRTTGRPHRIEIWIARPRPAATRSSLRKPVCYTHRVSTPARVAAIIVLTMLAGACSSSSDKSSGPPASFAELEAHLISKAPRGFVQQADDVDDTGPSDLTKAAREEGGTDPSVLRAEGFVRGFQRLWIGPEHAQVIVSVHQFETNAGARRNFARFKRASDAQPPRGARKFTLPFVGPTQGVGFAGTANGESAAAAVYFIGVFGVQVICNGPRLSELQTRAIAVAKNQLLQL
jgi:hypothetical protein